MKKFILAIVLAVVTCMAALTFTTPQIAPIDRLVVFGDSLSDTGTVFQATNGLYPPDPPYFQGCYSNGRVWVEYLVEQFSSKGKIENLACGGATTGQSGGLVPGLLSQVQSWLQSRSQIDHAALYVLWAGANDYLQGASDAKLPVQHVIEAVTALAQAGAERILVANLPNLGQLPSTRSSANSAQLTALTQAHNQNLRRSLKLLDQQPDLKIMVLDANALYRLASAEPARYQLSNVTGTCLTGTRACGNPDQFLFWDGIHPTTAAHRILAQQAFAAVQEQLNVGV